MQSFINTFACKKLFHFSIIASEVMLNKKKRWIKLLSIRQLVNKYYFIGARSNKIIFIECESWLCQVSCR